MKWESVGSVWVIKGIFYRADYPEEIFVILWSQERFRVSMLFF